MKKTYSILLLIYMVTVTTSWSQTIVSTVPDGRNAILEEFTGVNCPNCPDGHVRAAALAAAHPGRVVIINVHSGYFAVPSSGQPDFRTPYGDPIDVFAGVAAYPSGTINRTVFPGAYNQPPYFPQNPPNNMAIRRPGWWDASYPGQGAGEYIILNGGLSPVNIGAQTTWNATTRNLTINVELYYTASDSTASDKLNVVLTENHVFGYQSGGSSNYDHKHIMRDMITGQWGEVVTPTAQGTLITRTYNYTVPLTYNIDNCDLNIFVTRDNNASTLTGVSLVAKNGTTVGVEENSPVIGGLGLFPNPVDAGSTVYFGLSKSEEVAISILDLTGRTVAANSKYYNQGAWEISLNDITKVNALSEGIYLLAVTAGGKTETIKFVVE